MTTETELQRRARLISQGHREALRALRLATNIQSLDSMKRIAESPTIRAMREISDSPVIKLMREMQESSSLRALREIQNSPAFKLQSELAVFNEQRKLFEPPSTLLKQIADFNVKQEAITESLRLTNRYALPQSALQDAAAEIARQVSPPYSVLNQDLLWAERLRTIMGGIKRNWVSVDHPALSFEGLAVLTKIADTIRLDDPFSLPTRELVDDSLGYAVELDEDACETDADYAHLDAGMNAGLVSLAPPETGEILALAGFNFGVPFGPLPRPENDQGEALHYDPSYAAFVAVVERHLRAHVDEVMTREYGEKWVVARVSKDKREEWLLRQEKAVADGEPQLPLLNYSDFIDLKDIMIGKKTWGPCFAARFGVRAHFETMMDRVYAVRKPLAHSRPISNGQLLHLLIEGRGLMKALNVPIFKN